MIKRGGAISSTGNSRTSKLLYNTQKFAACRVLNPSRSLAHLFLIDHD